MSARAVMIRLALALAVLSGAGAGIRALADEPQPQPQPAPVATTPEETSADAADDAATAAAAAAAEDAAMAAAAGQAVDAAVEAAAEKAGVTVEPETIVPVGAEPVEVSPPLSAPAATAAPLPELIPELPVQPVPLPPTAAPRPKPAPRPAKPKVDPLKGLAADATATEIEAVLAQAPQTYLVLDMGSATLSVKARGITLETMPIRAAHVLYRATLLGTGERDTPATPSVWKVAEAPEDLTRELIAPAELKPYVPEEEREEVASPSAASATGTNAKRQPEEEELKPPANYRVRLDRGWELAVLERSPRRGILRRFVDAARSGWAEVLGRPVAHPPTFAVTVDAEDARRIHHLFRTDTAVLLTASRR